MSEPTTYPVKQFIDVAKMKRDLAISTANLSDAMMIQAALFAEYGMYAADAANQVDVVDMLLESTEATVYKLLRDEAAKAGEKVTEAQLEKMVAKHKSVVAMKQALNAAKRIEAQAKIALESLRHKRDMLVQLGATSREEMKGEVVTTLRHNREEVLRHQTDKAHALLAQRQ